MVDSRYLRLYVSENPIIRLVNISGLVLYIYVNTYKNNSISHKLDISTTFCRSLEF